MIDAGERLTMDRCDVGVVLGVFYGLQTIFYSSFSFFFVGRYIVGELNKALAWYLVSFGIGILILLGAFLADRGRKVTGGALMFIVSLFDLVTWIILIPPSMWVILISPSWIGSSFVVLFSICLTLFGMLGGLLILSSKTGTKQDK
jgi:hypothetical protein